MNHENQYWEIYRGNGPLVATAIHHGHHVQKGAVDLMAIRDAARLQEEDPYTGEWTLIGDTRIIGLQSRFEFDLNRPREKAIYIKPEDAWGLQVWKSEPPAELIASSLAAYDAFYHEALMLFSQLEEQFGYFVVFDLHSYNYRREGVDGPIADPEENPEVNIGTGTMDRSKWAPLVDRFISDLRSWPFQSRHLDVRENVKFKGGQFSRWIHQTFPASGCSISIEFKKFFMDEWSGVADRLQVEEIGRALQSTLPGTRSELKKLGVKWKQ